MKVYLSSLAKLAFKHKLVHGPDYTLNIGGEEITPKIIPVNNLSGFKAFRSEIAKHYFNNLDPNQLKLNTSDGVHDVAQAYSMVIEGETIIPTIVR